ncbi:hypothetical protein POTG_01768 [Paenibacillus sp. oral taxon 786 str. D14]|uniref:hypothetical protein n=1 Tax=Paenibacillus sp. oral taxon 786 TaxID=652715 RepID=UPI0001AFD2FF|nr:hypothetical protein [Paenibacillus sp. oral taxon 786]EES73473.1 hypothetical protein POTG_01768 [Paenibacillus sp. oral taxon 786 str. D14]
MAMISPYYESGISRLYVFLAHVKHFPAPVRFAAITAGISEQEVCRALERTPYTAVCDQIMPREELDRLGRMTIGEANDLYHTRGITVLCRDGRPVSQGTEDPGAFANFE